MNTKMITLSLIATSMIFAQEVELKNLNVESTLITEVAKKAQTSADLADVLSKNVPSVDMNRRSGIANDIIIRGQTRDNISIEIDGTKIYGACPNRMDPPVSHILASQIQDIEVTEGPYDVTSFGTMSGGLKIKTKQPQKGFQSDVTLGMGSFGYKKLGATVSGGNNFIRALASVSSERSNQYKDGDGNTLSQQMENKAPLTSQYHDDYKDMQAYKKESAKVRLFVNPKENHELRLSVTANRSDKVLYPNSPMDALYDDSNLYSVEYNIDNLSNVYNNFNLQYYYTEVEHPMTTRYRNQAMSMTNNMKSQMQGLKLKNNFALGTYKLLVGLDTSKRVWDGYYKDDLKVNTNLDDRASINNSDTINLAIFSQLKKTFGDVELTIGVRIDSTKITVEDVSLQGNNYTGFNANILANYKLSQDSKIFFGLGQAQRVPDARELYFTKYNMMSGAKDVIGNDTLDQTTNKQIDLGFESDFDSLSIKAKVFYSMLNNYIYFQKTASSGTFQNIDATIYGTEMSGSYFVMDELWIDASMSYKKGQKSEALATQTDKDLANMAPLRAKLVANYEYMDRSTASLEVQTSAAWSIYDADNGEQALDEWSILNFKIEHTFNDMFTMTLGVNNMLDKTYAMSNTYADLTLVESGANEVILLNEPGRYLYTNLTMNF